jgi:tripartite-type tricarboxylate transporter receptor subunit TctC
MKLKSKRVFQTLAIVVGMAVILTAAFAAAADYPRKPITVVVPWPAGSATGIVGQKIVNIILQNKYLPQPLQVVYKPGASGTIGLAEVLQGKPDGYTIAYNPSAPILVQPLVKELPYTHKSLVPIIQTMKFPWLLVVKNDAPWKTIQEFLDYCKKHTGEVTVGTAGDYTWGHLALLQMTQATGIKFRHVPFQGAAPNVTALLGGHVQASLVVTGDVSAQISAGKVRFIACVEPERSAFAPETPTFKELGYDVKGTMHTHIVVLPKGATPDMVEILHEAFKKAIDTNDYKEFMKQVGGDPGYISHKDLPAALDAAVKEATQLLEGVGTKIRKVQ